MLWDHFEKVGVTCVGSAKATFPWFFQRVRNVGATDFKVGATYPPGGIESNQKPRVLVMEPIKR